MVGGNGGAVFSRLFPVSGSVSILGGPEKARMLASAGMASFAVQALWNHSLALWLKQSVRLDHLGVTIFQLSRMQMLRGSGRILAEQKIKFQTH